MQWEERRKTKHKEQIDCKLKKSKCGRLLRLRVGKAGVGEREGKGVCPVLGEQRGGWQRDEEQG